MMLLILFVLFLPKMSQCVGNDPIVVTTAGPVRGKTVYNEILDLQYHAFHGIPYAESPTGNFRFKPPISRKPWQEIYNATKEGPVCPQPDILYPKEMMDEDCLYLNIKAPVYVTSLLPVLVHVHGGQFNAMSGNEDRFGTHFVVQRNIIGVTLNYRLGVFGFLSLEIEEASGNAAIKDVILALKWIQENIKRFGGDPKQVTLSGESAGSALAQYLLLTEKSKGLFQKNIQISGSALSYRFFTKHPIKSALTLTKALGCETDDRNLALKILREAAVFDIIDAVQNISSADIRRGFRPYQPFLPCVEIEYPDAVLTKHPRVIMEEVLPNNVPILAGVNQKEGMKQIKTIQNNETLIKILNANFELCIPSDIEFPYGSKESVELGNKIRRFYFDDDEINLDDLEKYIDLITDTQFYYSVFTFVRLHKRHRHSQPLYLYLFDFDGYLNWFKLENKIDYPGACHTDNIGYLFYTNITHGRFKDADKDSLDMLEINLKLFTNFIKLGNPTPEGSFIVWPEYNNVCPAYLTLNSKTFARYGLPALKRYNFWKKIYDDYYQYIRNGGVLKDKEI